MTRILLALAFVAACRTAPPDSTAATAAESPMTHRVLETGAYAAAANAEPGTARAARAFVARSHDAYVALWREHIGDAPIPPVDFARESAVFLLLGQRSTGGWSVAEPAAVSVRGTAVEVTAAIGRPAPGGITTMAFSAPFAVIAVGAPGLERAVWKDREGALVASSPETP